MSMYTGKDELTAGLGTRLVRTGLGVTATGLFLVGYVVEPAWIFSLSVLSIYLTVTAILGRGLTDMLRRAPQPEPVAVRRPAAEPAPQRTFKEAA